MQVLSWFPGVPIFFVVSGFLIGMSFNRNPDIKTYSRNRFLRIYPGLWGCFAVSILILLCCNQITLGTLSLREFWFWLVAQLSIGQFYNPLFLRSFGIGVINGSLWTIPVEIQYYVILPIIVLFIAKYTKLSSKNLILILMAIISLASYGIIKHLTALGDSVITKLLNVTIFPHLFMFLLGLIFYYNIHIVRRYIAGSFIVWTLVFICTNLLYHYLPHTIFINGISFVVLRILLAVWALSFAYTYCSLSKKLLHKTDISYGIYLYHMPVTNVLIFFGFQHTYIYLIIAVVITIVLALFSWWFIESPALKLKKKSLCQRI
jgi:peptidoglycan/LPS O-acetylase OafA/YrhL